VLFDYDGDTGKLTERQTLSSLPPGYAGSNFCSEILVSGDGKFVYAGNRLHDSIGIFAVGRDGRLEHRADEWTRGNYPRSFSFTPMGISSTAATSARTTSPSSGSTAAPAR
jgi:6-phosphogluconolactonase (cycloisomerase 2 family)